MSDSFTILNPGVGGDVMDEEEVGFSSDPLKRKRERVQIAGSGQLEIARVINSSPIGNEYALVTRPILTTNEPIVEYGTVSLVPSLAETTVVSYIVPVSKIFHGYGFIGAGDVNAKFIYYVDILPKVTARTTVAQQTTTINFSFGPFVATAGQTVFVKAKHYISTVLAEFEATILGYLESI